jgi:hypothetical protein
VYVCGETTEKKTMQQLGETRANSIMTWYYILMHRTIGLPCYLHSFYIFAIQLAQAPIVHGGYALAIGQVSSEKQSLTHGCG